LVAENCRCCYRYSLTKWEPTVFPKWFRKITQRVLDETGLEFEHFPNSCNVNWYQNGADSVGWHSDDESLFQSKDDDTLILSLSLGQSRKFEVKLAEHKDDGPMANIKQMVLHHGDIMTMEGLFQKYYVHRVPKAYGVQRARVNLTWRWIKKHDIYRDRCRLRTPDGPGTVKLQQRSKETGD